MKRILSLLLMMTAISFAENLDMFMQHLKQDISKETKEQAQRKAKFLEKKNQQYELLKNSETALEKSKLQSQELQTQFDMQEESIKKRKEELRDRMGNLGEIFGVVHQNAGDTSGIIRSSLVSAEYPHRTGALDNMAKSKSLPNIKALEKLWLEILNEIVESGKTSTFSANVIKPDGTTKKSANVTRIGTFTVIADGKFVRFDNGKLIELPRQPSQAYTALAKDVQHAQGIVKAPIDPTRGAILELMMEKPTFMERIKQGGLVGYVIIALGVIGILIALVKLVLLITTSRKVNAQLKALETPNENNPLGRVLGVYNKNKNESVEIVESRLDEAILKELPRITSGESVIKLFAAIAPLLGLLGTVVGMIATFQAITLFGTGDPKLMAGGISQALVTTMLGLIVAVPLLFAHSIVRSRSKKIIEILSQQSAGMIARRMEH